MNTGRNLADIFSAEIAHYSNPWDWIKDRIDIGCYTGLNDEDFIPMLVENETHEMQIAGRNTYTRTTDQDLGNHIDFISRDCYSQPVQWNTTNNNNGTAEQQCPYLASNVYKFLNEELYSKLPESVKNVITSKRTLLEKRYSSSGKLGDSTGWAWSDIGYLWLLSEYEIYNSTIWGTKSWSAGQDTRYALFANSNKNRIKGAGVNGERCHWWLLTIMGGDSGRACGSAMNGYIDFWGTTNLLYVPICFRIAAHQ